MSSLQDKLSNITLPLWRLKLTKEEYDELKTTLRRRIQEHSCSFPYQKEACMYYAEWWKREYTPIIRDGRRGGVSKKDVFDSLEVDGDAESFFQDAWNGAQRLGIELVTLGNTDRKLYSMLYQGGLPMHNVSSDQTADGWDKFIRGLVLRDYDFSILPNQSAGKSNSLIAFCDLIKQADDQDNPELMPFFCEDPEGWSWYQFVHEEIRKGKKRLAEERPFKINWDFSFDHLRHALQLDYVIEGPQRLPEGFLNHYNFESADDISIDIYSNNSQVFLVHYISNLLSKRFLFKSSYQNNDIIAIGLRDGDTILSDSLDLDIPHIVCEEKKGLYQLGNKIGTADSYIVFSEEWEPEEAVSVEPEKYTYCDQAYRLIHIPKGEETEVTLKNKLTGDSILFSPRVPLSWTEVYYPEDELNYVFKDPVFDPATCIVFKKNDKVVEKCRSLLYRAVGAQTWTETLPVGSFFVRPKDSQFVSPARAVSLGYGYRPQVQPSRESCSYSIKWNHGRVRPFCGKEVDGKWVITKDDCEGRLTTPCTFTPRNEGRSFNLSLRIPFVDFRIYDFNMNPVCDGDTIPFSDINIYTYCFAQSGAREESFRFSFSKTKGKYFAFSDGKRMTVSKGGNVITLPCEGSLESLLGGVEKVAEALGKDGTPLKITFSDFDFDPQHKYSVLIAWRPFDIVKPSEQPVLRINENNANGRITYVGDLRVFPLDGSLSEPFAIKREEDGTYSLPDSTPETFLVAEDNRTSNNGKLRIRMHSMHDVNDSDRTRLAIESQRRIYRELMDAPFNAAPWIEALYWFRQSIDFSLPPVKLFHLKLIGSNDYLLNFFCFHCFVLSEKNTSELKNDLLELEEGLSFRWWMLEKTNLHLNPSKINTESFPEVLLNWARKISINNNDIEGYKKTLDKEAFLSNYDYLIEFYEKVMNEFAAFKKDLISESKRNFVGGWNHESWKEFIEKDILSLTDLSTPDNPMLDYSPDLTEKMEKLLFPQDKFPPEFTNYSDNSKYFLKRVYRLAEYMNGKDNDVFFHGSAEDICDDSSSALERVQIVRNSIAFYLNKDKDLFLNHLIYIIRRITR